MATGRKTVKSELYASTRKEWRIWLTKNHTKAKEIWLVYSKKNTGEPSVKYLDSVEEALCFGWIDGLKKRVDEKKYKHRFTPRKSDSR